MRSAAAVLMAARRAVSRYACIALPRCLHRLA